MRNTGSTELHCILGRSWESLKEIDTCYGFDGHWCCLSGDHSDQSLEADDQTNLYCVPKSAFCAPTHLQHQKLPHCTRLVMLLSRSWCGSMEVDW